MNKTRIVLITILLTLLVCVGTVLAAGEWKLFGTDVLWGRETPYSAIQDFYYDYNDFALKARKIYLADVGDPPDLALRRAGPDNASFDAAPQQLEAGSNIGTLYWQARTANGWDGRNAQIYVRAEGAQTPQSAGGSLHLATTPIGSAQPVVRIVVEQDGVLNLSGIPTVYDSSGCGMLRVKLSDGSLRNLRIC